MLALQTGDGHAPETEKPLKTQLLLLGKPASPPCQQRLLPITRSTPCGLLGLADFGGMFTGEV